MYLKQYFIKRWFNCHRPDYRFHGRLTPDFVAYIEKEFLPTNDDDFDDYTYDEEIACRLTQCFNTERAKHIIRSIGKQIKEHLGDKIPNTDFEQQMEFYNSLLLDVEAEVAFMAIKAYDEETLSTSVEDNTIQTIIYSHLKKHLKQ